MTNDWKVRQALKAEIANIQKLDPNPLEAMNKWIDRELGIPDGARGGGVHSEVDALPVYLDFGRSSRPCYAAPVPLLEALVRKLKQPYLVGLVKFQKKDNAFLGAIPLLGFRQYWEAEAIEVLKRRMRKAYDEKDKAFAWITRE